MKLSGMHAFVTALGIAAAAGSVAAQSYNTVVVPPIPGGFTTAGYGVNELGWVVGSGDSLNGVVAFVFHDGQTEELPLLSGGSEGQANSVNSAGTIVGQCRDATNVLRAVKWERDGQGVWQITDLGTFAPGDAGLGVATRINEAGQIVGYANAATGSSYHGFIMTNGVKVDVGTLGFSGPLAYSQALGVNELGEVTGFAYRVLGGPEHGLFYTGGRGNDISPTDRFGLAQWHNVTASGMLGGYISGALGGGEFKPATYTPQTGIVVCPILDGLQGGYGYDINNDGVLVGTMFYLDADPTLSVFKAFMYHDGVTTDLNTFVDDAPGVLFEAHDIAHNGMIVANAEVGFGSTAVLLTPAPPACAADFNHDGSLDPDDLGDYINCYFSTPPCEQADTNADGSVDPDDLGDFINLYFAGC